MTLYVVLALMIAVPTAIVRLRRKGARARGADAVAAGIEQAAGPKHGGIPQGGRRAQRPDTHKPSRTGTKRLRWRFYDRLAAFNGDFWGLLDASSIIVFVGPNGSGKSLAAVASLLPVLDGQEYDCTVIDHRHHRQYQDHVETCDRCTMGVGEASEEARCTTGRRLVDQGRYGVRRVYSTAELLDQDGQPHPLFVQLQSFQQLVRVEHADIFFDEVAGVMDSGESDKIPVQVRNFIRKLRHFENRLLVTSPAYMNCAKSIRQVCQVVVDSRSFFPEKVADGRRWKPMRGMVYRAYDAFGFEDFTASSKETQPLLVKTYFWRPGSRSSSSYNSLGQVQSLGHVDESGLCMGCGGTRRAPACACPDDVDPVEVERYEVVRELRGTTRTKRLVLRAEAQPPTDDPAQAVGS
jgi:hypothetical protein